MPSKYWISSIPWHSDSSGGLLPEPYEKLSDQSQANEYHWIEKPFSASFYATVNSPGEQLSLWIEAKEETDIKRFLSCLVIARLPEKALDESLRLLKDIYEFHVHAPRKILPGRRTGHRATGRIVEEKQRPNLVIGE